MVFSMYPWYCFCSAMILLEAAASSASPGAALLRVLSGSAATKSDRNFILLKGRQLSVTSASEISQRAVLHLADDKRSACPIS